jgi:hypothetical protein
MLGTEFIGTQAWEAYPFVDVGPFTGVIVDASITSSENTAIEVTRLTPAFDVEFSAIDKNGVVVNYDTALSLKQITVYGTYTMIRAKFNRLVAVFLVATSEVADISGNSKLTSKTGVVQSENVFSVNTLNNFVKLLGGSGLSVEVNSNGEIQISRDDTNPCPENCPQIPILTINKDYSGARDVGILGNCNSPVNDSANHAIELVNQCKPCCDCEQQSHVHDAIVKTYEYYNNLVEQLELISEQYTQLKKTLIDRANAENNTLAIAEINTYMPDTMFRLKQ